MNKRERYLSYIMDITYVGETFTTRGLQIRLAEYDPNEGKEFRLTHSFKNSDLPNTTLLGHMLKASGSFKRTEGRSGWRRIE
jgi:hypothetical protein